LGASARQGLPLGSGLGSSAASAGAACWAVNALFGSPLSKADLVPAGLVSEAHVSGYHADNIAPAIMGGFVMIRTYDPELQLMRLPWGGAEESLWFSVVTPIFECPTKLMRAALPKEVPFKSHTHNSAAGDTLSAGILLGTVDMLGQGLSTDCIVEPARGPLIPGFAEVKAAALAEGASGCTISGAGPTIVAVSKDKQTAIKAAEAMVEAFRTKGNLEVNRAAVVRLCEEGSHSCAQNASTDMPSAHFVV
jgi:homoserine kinase